jgi:hypothetical protein
LCIKRKRQRFIILTAMKGKTMDTEQPGLTIERGARLTFVDREKGRNVDGLFIGAVDKGDLVVAPLSDHQPQLSTGAILNGRFLSREDMVAFTSEIPGSFRPPGIPVAHPGADGC